MAASFGVMAAYGIYCSRICLSFLVLSLASVWCGADAGGSSYGDQDCCWGDLTVPHGHTAISLPHCCTTFQCDNGRIHTRHIGTPQALNCCEFDGVLYPSGAQLAAHCVTLVCSRGNWTVTAMDDCCAHCTVYDDPHFTTWDGHHYDFHRSCNYSLAQTDNTMAPHTAVYSSFKTCFGQASCLHLSTFRENPHTVITLGQGGPYDLAINGEDYTVAEEGVHIVSSSSGPHPVLAWRQDHCLHLLGASKLMLLHCPHQLEIWAFPIHTNSLGGLCGHFNFYRNDDLTSRSGQVTPLTFWPLAFPESWKTNDQTDYECRKDCEYCPAEATDPCQASPDQRELHRTTCKAALHPVIGKDVQLRHHIESCTFDLCMFEQTGATTDERKWIIIIIIIVYTPKRNIARIEDGWEASAPPSSGVCSPGARWMKNCNWCTCNHLGTSATCTLIGCAPDYIPDLGEPVCENGSWWRPDDCNWCQCVRGGSICTHQQCLTLPVATLPTPSDPSACYLPVDPGSCNLNLPRYHYNTQSGQCHVFNYGGCLGNKNNFLTLQECLARCGDLTIPVTQAPTATPQPFRCQLPLDPGPCRDYVSRYYYDSTSHHCRIFYYGGCKGNYNNFLNVEECLKTCSLG